jgi:hypothetical protein
LALLALIAGGIWWWCRPAPLASAETALVGTWTLPTGTQQLPPNSVQQLFEMRSDRTLILGARSLATGEKTSGSRGTWRLEEGVLVWDFPPRNAVWIYLQSLVGGPPAPKRTVEKLQFLRVNGDRFVVAASDGSEATFLRLPE